MAARHPWKRWEGWLSSRHASLRMKSYIVYGVLIISMAAVTLFLLYQKNYLTGQFDIVQAAYENETKIRELDLTILHTLQAQVVSIESIGIEQDVEHTREHLTLLLEFFDHVVDGHIKAWPEAASLHDALRQAHEHPTVATMAVLGQRLNDVRRKLEKRLAESRSYRLALADEFRQRSDSVGVVALVLMMLVFAMLGVINALFFTRLTKDVRSLKKRAQEIVDGNRGGTIPVARHDEVGELIESINHMAVGLEERDRALEVERRKSFHQEKMAAVGVLAAGIAHEIGNPIAAIAGLIEDLKQTCLGDASQAEKMRKLDMVLEQTHRLSAITREVSTFARPQLNERVLLDLNGLIRSTCSLMRYDKRWKNIRVDTRLDTNLPGVRGVPDQLMQVIMNLLVNASDAVDAITGREPEILIETGLSNDGARIYIAVQDNGIGMDEETARQALDAFYTTKEAGKGTGLGLFLCESIIAGYEGGEIDIDSTPGGGTKVMIHLPLGSDEITSRVVSSTKSRPRARVLNVEPGGGAQCAL